MRVFSILLAGASIGQWALAQYFPPEPKGITTLKSKLQHGVSISYKETHICETTPGVKSYSGYVHLPSSILQDVEGLSPYNISTFFWFFEARHDPKNAPLSIYLAGGPGESSMFPAAAENGPCYVNPDSNSTVLNPWSFNNHVNMLYIDQPNQVGFSYDSLINGTLDVLTGDITPGDFSPGIPTPNQTLLVGTFPTQNPNTTANNTAFAAKALWHFTQSWSTEFPKYNPKNDKISLWANSYGGFFGPATFAYFAQQNKKIKSGHLNAHYLHLDALGITNGCMDLLYQARSYPEIAYNNTYGHQWIPKAAYEQAIENLTKPGGCYDLILQCRELGAVSDPGYSGSNETVNSACLAATVYCGQNVLSPYDVYSGRSDFDMAQFLPEITIPAWYPAGFFNRRWVQEALGVPVNFTVSSNVVMNNLLVGTGDTFRREGIKDLEYLLGSGVKVALVYGDRDYRCNWVGAENISLSVDYPQAKSFRSAGYEKIVTNKTYNGGVVRQYGNFSFSRVFQAGHAVSAYQPETVYRIFMRAMFNTDVATGKHDTSGPRHSQYGTKGPKSSFGFKNVLPESKKGDCYIYAVGESCTDKQIGALEGEAAVVRDFVVVDPKP